MGIYWNPYCNVIVESIHKIDTVHSHYLPSPISKWKSGPCLNMKPTVTTGNKILWKREESAPLYAVERCGAVVKRRTRDREVPGSIPTNCKCCFLEQETLSTLLSTGFYPGKKRATWKISTILLNVLPSINKVDYYYYYYYYLPQYFQYTSNFRSQIT